MKRFVWCSPHTPTKEQLTSLKSMGEIEYLKDINPSLFNNIANSPTSKEEMRVLADELYSFVCLGKDIQTIVQPAGSPAFQFVLGQRVKGNGNEVIYAHSKRVSEDIPQPDGSIKKVSTFKHLGWV